MTIVFVSKMTNPIVQVSECWETGNYQLCLSSFVEVWGSFDFIVVGAGSSGSVVSARLSENPETKVLVLEAGGEENQITDIPAMAAHLQHTEYNWGYKSTPQKSACLG